MIKTMETHRQNIIKKINNFIFKVDLQTLFRDCIHIMALRIALMTDIYNHKERNAELERVTKKYKNKEVHQIEELINAFYEMFIDSATDFGDHLGAIFMGLAHKGNHKGQFFTPYNISRMIARMQFSNPAEEIKRKSPFSIADPCCGAGGLLVAACEILTEKKINYTKDVIFYGADIDLTCVEMTYLQLTFLGASALIEHKDTLLLKKWDEYRTPGIILAHTDLLIKGTK